MQGLGVGDRLVGGAHVRLGNDLQQRRAGAVQVDAGFAVEILVQRLAGILFQMGARQTDDLLVSLVAGTDLQGQIAADHHRQIHLADLVALGEVRVKVVLAREHRLPRHLGADRQAKADGAIDGLLVEDRQNAGQGEVDRASLGIRLGTEGGGSTRENLRNGRQLRVRFDADDDFPLIHNFIRFTNIGRFSIRRVSATNNRMPCPRTTSGSR